MKKFLVRKNDFHIFEVDETNGCYRSWSTKNVTDSKGNRPQAMSHFTFENLTENYDFFPIQEEELEFYNNKHNIYLNYFKWTNISDGHGGIKGGTFEEYVNYPPTP
jgi:hypothetical protein